MVDATKAVVSNVSSKAKGESALLDSVLRLPVLSQSRPMQFPSVTVTIELRRGGVQS